MLASRIGRGPYHLIQKIKGAITDKTRSQVVSEDLCSRHEELDLGSLRLIITR